jgi:8-oxo-dGTP pyrophosphatase MutT (NUDIX family)
VTGEVEHHDHVTVILGELRRPLPPEAENRVQEIWSAATAENPTLRDGTILFADGSGGPDLQASPGPYRHYLARRRDPSLMAAIPGPALGVSGVTLFEDGRVLIGRRASDVTDFPGRWELLPSGSVEQRGTTAGERVDVIGSVLDELSEEAGIDRDEVSELRTLGLFRSPENRVLLICFALVVRATADDVMSRSLDRAEYSDLVALSPAEALGLLEGADAVPASPALLRAALA